MTWPTDKAATTYVDNDADPIWRARSDIKKNFDNVNSIIDHFNIAGATQGQTLEYDATNDRWNLSNARATQQKEAVISLDERFTDASGFVNYTGGYTIEYTNTTGITVGTESGRSIITFPAGSYVIRMLDLVYDIPDDITFRTRWTDSSGSTVYWQGQTYTTFGTGSNRNRDYVLGTVETFASETDVYMEVNFDGQGSPTYQHPNLHIERIA